MPRLPFEPRLENYNGSKEKLIRENIERNNVAKRVVRHLNKLIANTPDENQQYFWADLALDLELSAGEVQSAVRNGGHNGVTLQQISPAERAAIARFK